MRPLLLLLLSFTTALAAPNPLLKLDRLVSPDTPEIRLRIELGTVLYDTDNLLSYLDDVMKSIKETQDNYPLDEALQQWTAWERQSALEAVQRSIETLENLKATAASAGVSANLQTALSNVDSMLSRLSSTRSQFASISPS